MSGGEAVGREIGPEKFRTVLYADLVNRPELVMRPLSEFLDLTWSSALATFEGQQDEFDLVLRTTGKRSTTLESLSRPLFNDRVGVWQRDLDPAVAQNLLRELEKAGGWSTYRRLCDAWGLGEIREAV